MLTFLADLFKDTPASTEELSTLEQLEQTNSDNATERHLVEFEKDYDDKLILPTIGQELAVSTFAGSFTQYFLLGAVESIGFSFNPIPLGLLLLTGNLTTAVITSDKRKKFAYKILMSAAKFSINTAVNSNLMMQAVTKHQQSVATVESIRQSIKDYENGYKPPSSLSIEQIGIVVIILLFLFGVSKLRK